MKYLFYAFALVNLFGLLVMWWDKLRAGRQGARRVPERTLFLVALCGGSLGCWAGMYLFRHKTQHPTFTVGIPLIIALQTAGAVYFMM